MAVENLPESQVNEIAQAWFTKFQSAATQGDVEQLISLFNPDQAYLRDILTFSWDYRTLDGQDAIRSYLEKGNTLKKAQIASLELEGSALFVQATPDYSWIQVTFKFETTIARGRGLFRLTQDKSGEWKALSIYMGIEELKGHEEAQFGTRPKGVEHGTLNIRQSWRQRREQEQEFKDRQPQVLIVGAGQAGLMIAARLRQLKVDALVIDKHERVGDNWRKRYEFLVLHDPVWYDHFPYIPFPPHWPIYTPKDKLADWLEQYAKAMELNIWTSSSIAGASFDEASGTWSVDVQRNGEKKLLKPKHVIIATGHSGEPNVPIFPGQEKFKGKIYHSSLHTTAQDFKGKKAVVVGCCNSGHDIAQDFAEHGVETTIVQRSSTLVATADTVRKYGLEPLYAEGGPPTDDADLIFASIPAGLSKAMAPAGVKAFADADRKILDGLAKVGFKTNTGVNGEGLMSTYFNRGGGYYLDVGASSLIAEGKIRVKQGHEIASIKEDGVVFDDDSFIPADIIILATGYQNMRTTAVKILGKEAERVREVWGLDSEGEIKTMWRPSGHPALWMMGGNLALCRFNSKRLALQIKARLEGFIA